MAWNQPGGNGKENDPWGNRGGSQQGPPDLDEVLRKLQSRLGKVFGGKGSGSGSGSGGGGFKFKAGGVGIGLILAAALFVWGIAGVYIVDASEQAVVLRFGQYVRTVGPGPHWVPYFVETYETVNVQRIRSQEIGFRTQGATRSQGSSQMATPSEALMLTEDENIVNIQFAVQYRVSDPAEFLFNVADPELTLRQATESAVREIVGRTRMDLVITEGRDAVAAEADVLTQDILDRYGAGLLITSVNMQNAQPPEEVQDAFFDAIKAREDQERVINLANAYASKQVPEARGEAQAIARQADGYSQRVTAQAEGEASRFLQVLAEYEKAPEVTRERLYLEAVESVMSRSSKVLLDVEGGNSLMYLPIDKLLSEGRRNVGAEPASSLSGVIEPRRDSSFDDSGRRSRNRSDGRSR